MVLYLNAVLLDRNASKSISPTIHCDTFHRAITHYDIFTANKQLNATLSSVAKQRCGNTIRNTVHELCILYTVNFVLCEFCTLNC